MKKFKKIIIGLIVVALILLAIYFGKSFFPNEKEDMMQLGYSETSAEKIGELDLGLYLNDTYYETLDKVLESGKYVNDYLEHYIKIDYINNDGFIDLMNDLLEKGYESEKINELTFIFEDEYFKKSNLERYLDYYNAHPSSKDKIVMYVNIGLDNDFYTNIKTIENPSDLLVLVNKYNKLPDNYYPSDAVAFDSKYTISSATKEMRKVAHDAAVKMMDDISKDGSMRLRVNSALRTKSYQNTLFTNSVSNNGMKHALLYSAKSRHSEHEAGLAVDFSARGSGALMSEANSEYDWLKENAHKYGFIERYPKGKEHITGYGYEPWHYRYVGVDVATVVKTEGITFEEYAVKYINY